MTATFVLDWLTGPFIEFAFMRRALLGTAMLCASACPIGVFLTLRRMSLTGDALAHGILPGAAAGFLLFGLQILPMAVGGVVAGLTVALGAGAVSRLTLQKEDASLAALYLLSLATGVLMVSARGSSVDLMHVLFGTVLALDAAALILIAGIATVSLVVLTLFWRGLVAECLDPLFLRSVVGPGTLIHLVFLGLTVLNLVAGFQALGTLLSVGLMILPPVTARLWARRASTMCALAVGLGMLSAVVGLLLSFHGSLPSGPAIILCAGALYIGSLLLAPRGLLGGWFRRPARASHASVQGYPRGKTSR